MKKLTIKISKQTGYEYLEAARVKEHIDALEKRIELVYKDCMNCIGKHKHVPLPSHDTREKIEKIGEIIWVEAKTVTCKKADDIAKKILEVIHEK